MHIAKKQLEIEALRARLAAETDNYRNAIKQDLTLAEVNHYIKR